MRKAFAKALYEVMEQRPDVWLLYGDVGYGVLNDIAKEWPDRCLNCGIAEQNMMGVAAGLALSGKTVFVYSIANFVTLRCLEQIRNDVCHHNANVKIVGVGIDRDYANAGYSHWGLEDGRIVECLPNIRVIEPTTAAAVSETVKQISMEPGPFYIRLRRASCQNAS